MNKCTRRGALTQRKVRPMETNGSERANSTGKFLPRRIKLDELVLHWESSWFGSQWPALYELLALAKMDGHYRAGATLSFFCEQGKLKASLYDRASQMGWFMA